MNPTDSVSTFLFTILAGLIVLGMALMFRRVGVSTKVLMIGVVAWLAVGVLVVLGGRLFGPSGVFLGLFIVPIVGVGVAFLPIAGKIISTIPLSVLVAGQFFRLPLELILEVWYRQGVMPVQMTYHGANIDILTGILALPAALWVAFGPKPHWIGWGFNLIGMFLLLRVVFIALQSGPTPLRERFGGYDTGPEVLLAFTLPHVFVITVAVFAAFVLHSISFRALLSSRNDQPNG